VRDVEDGEFGDALRVEERCTPGDGGAPIMTGEKDFLLAELVGDGDDIRNEFGQCVRSNAARFAAEVVSALVGHDDAKACGCEWLDLFVPSVAKFRETVKQYDHGATLGARGDGVQLYCVVLKEDGFQGKWPRGEILPAKARFLRAQNCILRNTEGPCPVN
jgi:hypothetical protein